MEKVRFKMKIQQLKSGYCKTRELVKTRKEFEYFSSIVGQPKNGFMVVYVDEVKDEI